PVGAIIARIRSGVTEAVQSHRPVVTPTQVAEKRTSTTSYQPQAATTTYKPQTNGSANRFYSPLVLNIAANEGVSMSELENIPGTGNEGRVTKKDILQYVDAKKNGRSTGITKETHTTQAGTQV